SVSVYVAPNLGGESFGMILTEAMAAGAPVVASDIEAFRPVLAGGAAGVLVPVGDAPALAGALGALLDDPDRAAAPAARARAAARGGSCAGAVVAQRVLDVYGVAIEVAPRPAAPRLA